MTKTEDEKTVYKHIITNNDGTWLIHKNTNYNCRYFSSIEKCLLNDENLLVSIDDVKDTCSLKYHYRKLTNTLYKYDNYLKINYKNNIVLIISELENPDLYDEVCNHFKL